MSEEVVGTAEAVEAEAPVSKVDISKYSVEDVQKQLKPLSDNGFVRFWQKIWRWWLGTWYGFCDKHPKLSSLLQMAFFFIVFSEGVTIYQYIVMTFLPYAFTSLWEVPFVWPAVKLPWDAAGNSLFYAIFNEPTKFMINVFDSKSGEWLEQVWLANDASAVANFQSLTPNVTVTINDEVQQVVIITGEVFKGKGPTQLYYDADMLNILQEAYGSGFEGGVIDLLKVPELYTRAVADGLEGVSADKTLVNYSYAALQTAGLGNFIAFEIAVFTAQCINFPLQRNITYRSHGNPWWQAMWYFIGWLLVSVATNAVWGILNPLFLSWNWPDAVIGLIKTILTGGVSLVIFFFIFMVIFPDNNKMVKKSTAKYEKLVAANAPTAKIVEAENKMKLWQDKALKSNTEKEYFKAKSQVSAAIMKYNALVKNSTNPKLKEEEKAVYPEKIEKAFVAAVEAIVTKDEKEIAFNEAKAIS